MTAPVKIITLVSATICIAVLQHLFACIRTHHRSDELTIQTHLPTCMWFEAPNKKHTSYLILCSYQSLKLCTYVLVVRKLAVFTMDDFCFLLNNDTTEQKSLRQESKLSWKIKSLSDFSVLFTKLVSHYFNKILKPSCNPLKHSYFLHVLCL